MTEYTIAWEAGPSAQIELFSPQANSETFRMKFSPPMRKTLRPPIFDLVLGPSELEPISRRIGDLVQAVDPRGPGGAERTNAEIVKSAEATGRLLQSQMLPQEVQVELAGEPLFVDLGLDEALLEYPWELMHDGKDFLGCKHSIGRFVNVSQVHIPAVNRPSPRPQRRKLSVLVISVPNPEPRDEKTRYAPLCGAGRETAALIEVLTAAQADVTPLLGRDANWDGVMTVLNDNTKQFHIIHYNGHATFNPQHPRHSALVLHDQNLSTGQILRAFETRPPVLFFVNGCETAKTNAAPGAKPGKPWQERFEIFGLARAFLDTGAYLLGTRWEVGDEAAALFAQTFYSGLLDEVPIGTVIRDARCACYSAAQKADTNDFSWASYAYYGDPRLYFDKSSARPLTGAPSGSG